MMVQGGFRGARRGLGRLRGREEAEDLGFGSMGESVMMCGVVWLETGFWV